jgi:hypothetical protein
MSAKNALKKPQIKLSFENDEEEENNEDNFGGKNLKFSKTRIKQANVKIPVHETTQSLVSSAQYDADALKQLKQNQKSVVDMPPPPPVVTKEPEAPEEDVMVLSGEAAELLEKQFENPQDMTSEEKLMLKQLEENAKMRNKKSSNRLYTDFQADDSRRNVDMSQDDVDTEWEREIMKRGAINQPSVQFPDRMESSSAVNPFDVDIMDIINNVKTAQSQLKVLMDNDDREIERLKVELEGCRKEIENLSKEQEIEETKYEEEKQAMKKQKEEQNPAAQENKADGDAMVIE